MPRRIYRGGVHRTTPETIEGRVYSPGQFIPEPGSLVQTDDMGRLVYYDPDTRRPPMIMDYHPGDVGPVGGGAPAPRAFLPRSGDIYDVSFDGEGSPSRGDILYAGDGSATLESLEVISPGSPTIYFLSNASIVDGRESRFSVSHSGESWTTSFGPDETPPAADVVDILNSLGSGVLFEFTGGSSNQFSESFDEARGYYTMAEVAVEQLISSGWSTRSQIYSSGTPPVLSDSGEPLFHFSGDSFGGLIRVSVK